MIINFTREQTEQGCRFPISCPVWIFRTDPLYDDVSKSTSFKRGRVVAVSMNFASKQLTYDVSIGDKSSEQVSEGEMGFGSQCPVFVSSVEDNEGDSPGVVLMCKNTGEGMVYTIQFMGRFEENVDAGRVSYRKVIDISDVPAASAVSQAEPSNAEGTPVESISVSLSEQENKQSKENTPPAAVPDTRLQPEPSQTQNTQYTAKLSHTSVPSSITCNDEPRGDTKLSDDTSLSVSGNPASTRDMACASTVSNKRQKTHNNSDCNESGSRRNVGYSDQKHRIQIIVPLWLQKDHRSQREIYCEFFKR